MAKQSEILQAEKVFFSALLNKQVDQLESLLTSDFSLIDLSGGLLTKAALLEAVRSGQLSFEGIEVIESTVRHYGETAVVTGRTEMHGALGEIPFTAKSRYTHIYVEQDGTLRFAAAQGTPMP